jgi:hypothetical protein
MKKEGHSMGEINVLKFIGKLMDEYGSLYEEMSFNFHKDGDKFIITKVSDNILDILKISQSEINGKHLQEFVNYEEMMERLKRIFEKAWKGQEAFCYLIPSKNQDVFLFILLHPVMKKGDSMMGEGKCFPLSIELLEKYDIHILDHVIIPSNSLKSNMNQKSLE